MGNFSSTELFYKTRILSELTGIDHTLSVGKRLYSLDHETDSPWKKEGVSYAYMLGYIEGLINSAMYLSNDIKNLPDKYLGLLANHDLCAKLKVTDAFEYVTTGMGSYKDWDRMIEREKKNILSRNYGRKIDK